MTGGLDVSEIWFACEGVPRGSPLIVTQLLRQFLPFGNVKRGNRVKDQRQKERIGGVFSFCPGVSVLLEGQTQPQPNRASIVYTLLGGADIVSPKVGINVYILNEELASRINVHIEIPDIREKRIER